jgi:hypothetical protein
VCFTRALALGGSDPGHDRGSQVRSGLAAGGSRIRTLSPSLEACQPGTRREPQVTATPVIPLAYGRVPERSLVRQASYWPLRRQDCYRKRSLNQG